MQNYINSIKGGTQSDVLKNTNFNTCSTILNSIKSDTQLNNNISSSDTFKKTQNNKTDKKKIFKIGAIITGIALAILAFFKRKRIESALSGLFNKNTNPEPPAILTPPTQSVPPKAPNIGIAGNPKGQSFEPVIQKPMEEIKKPTNVSLQTVQKDTTVQTTPALSLEEYTELYREIETLDSDEIINIITNIVDATAKETKEVQNELLNIYIQINNKYKQLPENSPERLAMGKKLASMREEMIKQNISFIPKAPESFANNKERWSYLHGVINPPVNNEATAIDALDVFEKYGGRYNENMARVYLGDIGISAINYANEKAPDIESANRIYQKYIDSVFKYATNEVPKEGYTDAARLIPIYNMSTSKMTKDTVIKFINAFKNIAADKKQYKRIKCFLTEENLPTFYPQLKPQDLPDIQKALDDFALAVAKLPDDIRKIK